MLSQKFRAVFLLFTLATVDVTAAVLKAGHQVGCGPGVAARDSFILTPDFGPGPYTLPVDEYLSDMDPGVINDIRSSLALARAIWQLKLSEFSRLTLETRRGGEKEHRVGIIQRPEVLPHRLTAGFVIFPEGPRLFTALPEQATPRDLSHLRHTIFYGMGLGVFCAVSDRTRSFHLFRLSSSTENLQASSFQIDDDWRLAQSRRRFVLAEIPRVHLRAGADLFANAFGRELAGRAGMPTEDFDALMRISGLEKSASRIRSGLEDSADSADSAREQALLRWGDQIIYASRLLLERPVADLETRIPEIETELLSKIRAVRVSRPDGKALEEARQGLKVYGQLLETRREEMVAERVKALDDLINQVEKP